MSNQMLRKFSFGLVLLFTLAMFWSAKAAEDTESAAQTKELREDSRVVVYYFHGERRCPTCRKIEELARSAVNEGFVKEIASGAVRFDAVNVDQTENRRFIQEYQLYTRTLILSEQTAGGKELRRENLDRIWELVHQPSEFRSYVQSELERFLSRGRCP